MTPEQIFNAEFKGDRNFMTPDLIRYGRQGPLVYELSTGKFMDTPLFGVTVLPNPNHDLNQCFRTLEDAESYIEQLP